MPKSNKKKKKKIIKEDLLAKALKRITILENNKKKPKKSKTRLARPIVQRPPGMNKRIVQTNVQPSAPMNKVNIEPRSSLLMTYDLLKDRDAKNNTDELIKRLPAQFAAQMQNQIAQARAQGEANVNIAITNALHNTQNPPEPLIEQNTSEPIPSSSSGPSAQMYYVKDVELTQWAQGKDLEKYGLPPNADTETLKKYIKRIRRMNDDGTRKSIDTLFNEANTKRIARLGSITTSVDETPQTPVSQSVQNIESASS